MDYSAKSTWRTNTKWIWASYKMELLRRRGTISGALPRSLERQISPRWIAWNDSVNIQYTENGHWRFKGKSCITNLGLNFLLHKDEEHEEEQREERKCSEIKRRRQKLQASHTGYKNRFRVTNGSDAPKTRCFSRLGLVKIAVIRIGLFFSFGWNMTCSCSCLERFSHVYYPQQKQQISRSLCVERMLARQKQPCGTLE